MTGYENSSQRSRDLGNILKPSQKDCECSIVLFIEADEHRIAQYPLPTVCRMLYSLKHLQVCESANNCIESLQEQRQRDCCDIKLIVLNLELPDKKKVIKYANGLGIPVVGVAKVAQRHSTEHLQQKVEENNVDRVVKYPLDVEMLGSLLKKYLD